MKKQRKLKLIVTKVSNLNELKNNILGGNTATTCNTNDCATREDETCGGAGKTRTTSVKVACFSTKPDIC